TVTLLGGLALTACGWLLLGSSLWAVLQALQPETPLGDVGFLASCIAYLAVAYVAGFLAFPASGGLGVREIILQRLLAPHVGDLTALVAVLLLRLLWTAAERTMAAIVYWLPRPPPQPQPQPPPPANA